MCRLRGNKKETNLSFGQMESISIRLFRCIYCDLFTSKNLTIFACLLKSVCITRERHLRKMFTRTANHPGKWSVDSVCGSPSVRLHVKIGSSYLSLLIVYPLICLTAARWAEEQDTFSNTSIVKSTRWDDIYFLNFSALLVIVLCLLLFVF